MKKILTICLLAVFTQACGGFSYKKAICNDTNMENIPGLPGEYIVGITNENFEYVEIPASVRWAGTTGRYQLIDDEVSVCRVGSKILIESQKNKLANAFGVVDYSVSELNLQVSPEGLPVLNIITLGLAKEDLEKRGIPYEIRESSGDLEESLKSLGAKFNDDQEGDGGDDGDDTEVLVKTLHADNSSLSSEQFGALFKRNFLTLTFKSKDSVKRK